MFKKILVPTDGSRLALQSAQAAVDLARCLHAEVIGFVATPAYKMRIIEDAVFAPGTLSEADFTKAVKRNTKKFLGEIEAMARVASVAFNGVSMTNEQPAVAIIDAADRNACDLIFMGSHGRSNIAQIFLGGVTTKVLALSSLPVMVFRPGKPKSAKRPTS
ncbi:MAG: universal stress protein [Betaproteobacteria bacterium]|nr:universal stress protein [Betaproteobacteria bacterium]